MNNYGGNRRLFMDDEPAGGHRPVNAARPALGFPLGTALILLIVFGISALFSCCYHWEKIRNMHSRHASRISTVSSNSDTISRGFTPTSRAASFFTASLLKSSPDAQNRSSVPVVMPGDEAPRFIARPAPHGFATHSSFGEMFSTDTSPSKNIALTQH